MSYQKKHSNNNNTKSELIVVNKRTRQSRNIQDVTLPSEFLRNI